MKEKIYAYRTIQTGSTEAEGSVQVYYYNYTSLMASSHDCLETSLWQPCLYIRLTSSLLSSTCELYLPPPGHQTRSLAEAVKKRSACTCLQVRAFTPTTEDFSYEDDIEERKR